MTDNQEPLIPEKTKTKPLNKKQTKIAEYPKNFTGRVEKVIDTLELPDQANRELLKLRFLDEVEFYEKKRNKTKYYYNIFRFVVTTGSILLPAILSIGQMDPTKLPKNFEQITYWSAWSISLMVTISNGFLQLFSLDKNYFNYFNYSLTVEQLKTEGWQFFGLSGKYEDYMKTCENDVNCETTAFSDFLNIFSYYSYILGPGTRAQAPYENNVKIICNKC